MALWKAEESLDWPIVVLLKISVINHCLFLYGTLEPSHLVLLGHSPSNRPVYVSMRQGYLWF